MNELDAESFAARYRLEPRDAHQLVISAAREGAPGLVGLALLVALCAATSVFGVAGSIAVVAVPAWVGWRLLTLYRRSQAMVRAYGGTELAMTFRATGLTMKTSTSRTEMAWAGLRRIERHRGIWVFTTRTRGRFFIPERAIPVEARALIARWAAAAKVRLV